LALSASLSAVIAFILRPRVPYMETLTGNTQGLMGWTGDAALYKQWEQVDS